MDTHMQFIEETQKPATTTDDIQPTQPEEPTIAPVQTELQQRAQQATQRQQEAQEQA